VVVSRGGPNLRPFEEHLVTLKSFCQKNPVDWSRIGAGGMSNSGSTAEFIFKKHFVTADLTPSTSLFLPHTNKTDFQTATSRPVRPLLQFRLVLVLFSEPRGKVAEDIWF